MGQQDNLRIRIYDAQLGQTADYDKMFLTGNLIDSLNRTQLVDLQRTLIFRGQAVLRSDIRSDTSDVERTQSQLRTRLTDRLRSDDTDNLTLLNHTVRSQVTAITLRTDTLLRLASQYGTDLYALNRRLFDLLRSILTDFLTGTNDDLARDRMDDVVYRNTTQDTLVEGSNYILVVLQLGANQTTQGAAVLLVDNHVVRDIDQTTRQITGVGRLQRSIRQTFSSTVGRDKVLQHRKTLLEVRQDRVLNDLRTLSTALLRLRHQTTHTRELTNLRLRTTGTGIHHHEDRVESVVVFLQLLNQNVRQLAVDVCPCIDNLVVTLVVGDETHVIVVHRLLNSVVTLLYQCLFLLRDQYVGQVE